MRICVVNSDEAVTSCSLLRLGLLRLAMSAALLQHLFELLLLRVVQNRLDPGVAVLHDFVRLGAAILL